VNSPTYVIVYSWLASFERIESGRASARFFKGQTDPIHMRLEAHSQNSALKLARDSDGGFPSSETTQQFQIGITPGDPFATNRRHESLLNIENNIIHVDANSPFWSPRAEAGSMRFSSLAYPAAPFLCLIRRAKVLMSRHPVGRKQA
jgi:hypothetical protein